MKYLTIILLLAPITALSQLDECGRPKTIEFKEVRVNPFTIKVDGENQEINSIIIRRRVDGSKSIEFWSVNPTAIYAEIPFYSRIKRQYRNILSDKWWWWYSYFTIIDFDAFEKAMKSILNPPRA